MDDIEQRIADLKAKLRGRKGKNGFAQNAAAIEEEVARLEASLTEEGDGAAPQPE